MKRKHIISLTIAIAFCGLSITGLLLWVKIKPHFVEITHTVAGLLFIGFAIYHIVNNWGSIVGYTKSKKTGGVHKEFWVAAAIAGVVLVGGLTEVLEPIAEAGREMGLAPKPKGPSRVSFEQIATNEQVVGNNLIIYIQKTKISGKRNAPNPGAFADLAAGWTGRGIRTTTANRALPLLQRFFQRLNQSSYHRRSWLCVGGYR